MREACRALRGKILRQEIYAEDDDPKLSSNPYTVLESNFTVELLQPKLEERYAGLAVHPRETLQLHYERQPSDPRIQHELVLKTSPYGDVVDQVAIAYPRRGTAVTPAQSHLWATWTHHDYEHLDALPDDYRVGIPFEETVAELAALASATLLSFAEIASSILGTGLAPYDPNRRPLTDPTPSKPVLTRQVRHYYWNDALTQRLVLGSVEPRGLPYETLTLALNDQCLQLFSGRAQAGETASAVLVDPMQAGYTREDGLYWSSSGVVRYDTSRFYLPISLTNPFGGVSKVDYDLPHELLPVTMTDPAGLVTQFENDWRLMAPKAMTDANGTRSEVTTDAFGIVVATTMRGAAAEGGPTAQMDYQFYSSPSSPTYVHVRTFPDYDPNGAVVEETYVYSDGMGREVITNVRVADGPLVDGGPSVSPRWVGSGRTIFNNKGLPVKKYEPYFAGNANYETEAAIVRQGVTPVLHYDPLGRFIRTDQPNGTFSLVEFDAWSQTTRDENDTVLGSKWYHDRTDPGTTASAREQAAAAAAAAHADTPKIDHFDPLGRMVLTILDNKTETHQTLHELDIEGNTLSITDPDLKPVATQWFDIAGRPLRVHSVDAGDAWTLPDAAGAALFAFRAQGAPDGLRIRTQRDSARRVTHVLVLKNGDPISAEALRERIVYGHATAGLALAHGRVLVEFDGAGVLSYSYDFRGNVVRNDRRVTRDYRNELEWSAVATFDGLAPLPASIDGALDLPLTVASAFDARQRLKQQTTPDQSVTTWAYDVGGQLTAVVSRLGRRPAGPGQNESFVKNIEYDAKNRRKLIAYGNGVQTEYRYDPQTFRLTVIVSTGAGNKHQELSYVYDPVGNITSVADAAQPTVCFGNQMVAARSDYVYDAVYRLTIASGREHPTQAGLDQRDIPQPLPLPTDCAAIVNYKESYQYSKAGNITQLAHTTFLPSGPQATTRAYGYDGVSNQLQSTFIGIDQSSYAHNARGDITKMPHLDAVAWNHRDQLIAATRTRRGNGPSVQLFPVISNPIFFAYDLRGQRVRKVSESGNGVADRVHLGPYEIYREHLQGRPPTLQRETLNVGGGAERVALVETLTDGSQELVRYQLSDNLASAILELDRSQRLLSYEEYHPYGTSAFMLQGSGVNAKRYRFTGKERDEETGLDYHGARYCAPWLGRWLSPDPKGFVDGTARYTYVRNSPIVYADPEGYEGEPKVTNTEPDPKSITQKANIGRAYEKEWQKHFESRPETARVTRQSNWKDPSTGKSVKLVGKFRRPDFAVETKLAPGKATIVEVSSPPNFASAKCPSGKKLNRMNRM